MPIMDVAEIAKFAGLQKGPDVESANCRELPPSLSRSMKEHTIPFFERRMFSIRRMESRDWSVFPNFCEQRKYRRTCIETVERCFRPSCSLKKEY